MPFLYELKCKCGESYFGYTKNLQKRIINHRSRLLCDTSINVYKHLRACGMTKNDLILKAICEFTDTAKAHEEEKKTIRENNCLNTVKYIDNYWSHWYNKNKAHRQAYEKKRGKCHICNKEMNCRSLKRHLRNVHKINE